VWWPKRIVFGHTKSQRENARKTHFRQAKNEAGFWPRTQTRENVAGGGVCARIRARSADASMQMRAMRDYAANRGWTVAMQVKEVGSGAAQREQRQQLIDAARRREIDVVLMWRLDRGNQQI
jgi:hypothetical protein